MLALVQGLALEGPFAAIHFAVYEWWKVKFGWRGNEGMSEGGNGSGEDGDVSAKRMAARRGEEEVRSNVLHHMAGGFVSGAIAAVLTAPLDLVKTRIQVMARASAVKLASRSSTSSPRHSTRRRSATFACPTDSHLLHLFL